MIHPILPFAIKGVIWYQGESNSNNVEQATAYREQFASLIESWRREFARATRFRFSGCSCRTSERRRRSRRRWRLRRGRCSASRWTDALALPNTGQAITIDVGEGMLHPHEQAGSGRSASRALRGASLWRVDRRVWADVSVARHAGDTMLSVSRMRTD